MGSWEHLYFFWANQQVEFITGCSALFCFQGGRERKIGEGDLRWVMIKILNFLLSMEFKGFGQQGNLSILCG